VYVRVSKSGPRNYLQIVESYRDGKKVRQRVIATLGRLEKLQNKGTVDGLLVSLAAHSDRLGVLGAYRRGEGERKDTRRIGPPLLFGRLWRRVGVDKILAGLLAGREFEFAVERAVFLTTVHRLMCSSADVSDRKAEEWRKGYVIEGMEGLDLHHLYRAMAWLGEPLCEEGQVNATPFSPRCVKDLVEETLVEKNRTLFSSFDLVFFDTTSLYFEGEGGETIGRYGNSKQHRPDRKQVVVGVVLDGEGRPVCSEIWPGNTTDVKTLIPVVDRLRCRFGIRSVCVVADRGMISRKTIEELEDPKRGFSYILGARMRRQTEVRDTVLADAGEYEEVHPPRKKAKDPSPLKVKEVKVEERRYIVCYNEEQARKDRKDREAILAGLADKLKQGSKAFVGNKGYRRYLKAPEKGFSIDEEKIRDEARYDGTWVLRTNTDLPAKDVALKYKQLWMVEQVFRTMKSVLDSRPIWHKCDETIRGHLFCSFLALVLLKELSDALDDHGVSVEWQTLRRDLDALDETELELQGKRFVIRSETRGEVGRAFQAVGAALPPTIRRIEQAPAEGASTQRREGVSIAAGARQV
jgi:hypothetical protein